MKGMVVAVEIMRRLLRTTGESVLGYKQQHTQAVLAAGLLGYVLH
jgi:hypothetical protein